MRACPAGRDACSLYTGFSNVVPRTAATASPGYLLEMQTLGLYSRSTELETLRVGPVIYGLINPPGDSNA